MPYESPGLQLGYGDQDWFQVTLPSTQTLYVTVAARSEGSTLKPAITLYSDQGSAVVSGSMGGKRGNMGGKRGGMEGRRGSLGGKRGGMGGRAGERVP